MWMNQQFSEIAEKEKHYHKSVTGIFPQVNKDQVNKADHVNIKVYKDDRIYRASISKIYFSDMLKESHSIESSGEEQYLTIMYLFDETLLNQYLKEKQDCRWFPRWCISITMMKCWKAWRKSAVASGCAGGPEGK